MPGAVGRGMVGASPPPVLIICLWVTVLFIIMTYNSILITTYERNFLFVLVCFILLFASDAFSFSFKDPFFSFLITTFFFFLLHYGSQRFSQEEPSSLDAFGASPWF